MGTPLPYFDSLRKGRKKESQLARDKSNV